MFSAMIFRTLLPLFLALFPAFVLSDYELNQNDVPQRCRAICEPVANLTRTCDVDDAMSDEEEDLLERQCICTNDSFDVANRTALCASCVDQDRNSTNSTTGRNSTGQASKAQLLLRFAAELTTNANNQISAAS